MTRRPGASAALAVSAVVAWLAAGAAPGPGAGPTIVLAPPLPADLPAMASFGEYRRGHLHAGLDFSTGGELGWPVRAAADGEVFRLKVEKRGYGRAVYVRHVGGHVTVYGHLHAFENRELGLENLVQEARKRTRQRHPGDLYPDPPVRVAAGQIIGLSGENGGGPPHLHFELRRDGEPVDPIRYGGLAPRGFEAPVLDALWILPRGATRIHGSWTPDRHEFLLDGDGYRIRAVPRIEGRFDLALTARVVGTATLGLSRIRLTCGGQVLFQADLHRFSFDQYVQSGLVYDPARSGTGPTRFTYRLRAAPGLDLPGVEGAWIRDPGEGRLECVVDAGDARGNTARGTFTLDVLPSPGYAAELPDEVLAHRMHARLLVLNETVPLDPLDLPDGAMRVPGMPQIARPGREAVTVLPLDGLEIRFPAGATYGPSVVSVAPDGEVPPPGEGLEVVIPPVRLQPDDLFLRREARWRARVPDPARSAIYRYDPAKDAWIPLGKEIAGGSVEEGSRHGGTYAVLRDKVAPRILTVQIRDEERLGARRLVFPIEEVGEGIDVEAFEAAVDGEPVESEYDPDRGWGQAWLRHSLRGLHRVTAACQDRAGNRSLQFDATVSF